MFKTEFTVAVSGLKKATPIFLFLELKEIGTARQAYEVFIKGSTDIAHLQVGLTDEGNCLRVSNIYAPRNTTESIGHPCQVLHYCKMLQCKT
jgi:hypothetical protein